MLLYSACTSTAGTINWRGSEQIHMESRVCSLHVVYFAVVTAILYVNYNIRICERNPSSMILIYLWFHQQGELEHVLNTIIIKK